MRGLTKAAAVADVAKINVASVLYDIEKSGVENDLMHAVMHLRAAHSSLEAVWATEVKRLAGEIE